MKDFSNEIKISTARSGGSGGQNVNKVETMAIAHWSVADSQFFTEEEKVIVLEQLARLINKQGMLTMKCNTYRTQLDNKNEVVRRMMQKVSQALERKKVRKETKIPAFILQKRKEQKQRASSKKQERRFRNFN